ncbi:MAG: hypothetical protein QXQ66_07435, partial [Candidatus Hadarchaeum sp.]
FCSNTLNYSLTTNSKTDINSSKIRDYRNAANAPGAPFPLCLTLSILHRIRDSMARPSFSFQQSNWTNGALPLFEGINAQTDIFELLLNRT